MDTCAKRAAVAAASVGAPTLAHRLGAHLSRGIRRLQVAGIRARERQLHEDTLLKRRVTAGASSCRVAEVFRWQAQVQKNFSSDGRLKHAAAPASIFKSRAE